MVYEKNFQINFFNSFHHTLVLIKLFFLYRKKQKENKNFPKF